MKTTCTLFSLSLLLHQMWTDIRYDCCGYWTFSKGFRLQEFTERRVLNDVLIFYHDSSLKSKMPCPDWINSTEGKEEWRMIHFWSDYNRQIFNLGFNTATQQFNLTGSLTEQNIYQVSGCCSLYPNGEYKSFMTHAFNGKDFASFDVNTRTFVAAVPEAVLYKTLREKDTSTLDEVAEYYQNSCLDQLKMFKQAPGVQVRKVPEVRILEKQKYGSITVTCHVTGFYPREVQVVWLGPDLQPVDEGFTEVLPNEDGTYQTRKILKVSKEDAGKHTYSCVVQHISVLDNITKDWAGEKAVGVIGWTSIACTSLLAGIAIGLGVWWRCKTRSKQFY